MTSENDFFDQIDETVEEWLNYLVFADFLQDRDDARADGFRALSALRIQPCWAECGIFNEDEIALWGLVSPRIKSVFWWCQQPYKPDPKQDRFKPYTLPNPWFHKQRQFFMEWLNAGGYPNRREAINGAARAFALLRPELQARYLKGEVNDELDGTDDRGAGEHHG